LKGLFLKIICFKSCHDCDKAMRQKAFKKLDEFLERAQASEEILKTNYSIGIILLFLP